MSTIAMAKFCDQCGTALNPDGRFCSGCGTAKGVFTAAERATGDAASAAATPAAAAVTASALTTAPSHTVNTLVLAPTKSVGVAILLTILFGPLGLFYSSVTGGIVMLLVSALVAMITFGLGLFITWPICVIWSAVAANSHNSQLMTSGRGVH